MQAVPPVSNVLVEPSGNSQHCRHAGILQVVFLESVCRVMTAYVGQFY